MLLRANLSNNKVTNNHNQSMHPTSIHLPSPQSRCAHRSGYQRHPPDPDAVYRPRQVDPDPHSVSALCSRQPTAEPPRRRRRRRRRVGISFMQSGAASRPLRSTFHRPVPRQRRQIMAPLCTAPVYTAVITVHDPSEGLLSTGKDAGRRAVRRVTPRGFVRRPWTGRGLLGCMWKSAGACSRSSPELYDVGIIN